ncbi:glycosyltransferase family 2 protein [Aestuariimicrobium sp. T2.26MG-19.2B]|uniref:glycosyltransferase family 2 protein n=1 Tax=Aestuariimicrobium sp. T2.26MG-19.2B TaxID=3040679 RepID=UPI0003B684CB|nr:glycosyltransferase family A protein [Aestuariimicrobium sp. T2.26MG-19.2B]
MRQPNLVAIGMATYKRQGNLRMLVPAVLQQAAEAARELDLECEWAVIVVDNDAGGSGEEAANPTGDSRVRYSIEPRPGVTSARNAVLRAASDCDVLIFIDDDELPQPQWLTHLLRTYLERDADVVSGPVQSVFEGPLDPWLEASDSHLRLHRSHLRTGDEITRAATNNLLLDMAKVRELGVGFDERFGLTGGEDSFFTGQLHKAGARMVWCAEAVVDDLVPAERANRDYNLRRRFSLSNASARVELMLADPGLDRLGTRAVCLARGVAQIGMGTTMAVSGRMGGSLRRRAHGERFVMGGLGALAAGLGVAASPYRRKKAR